ncbi:MAG TPA: class I SAM-dependent methyltransferase [Capillimicrobium sp.]|nr:class I SAM-dependent methyltransferase [Capillimicrobium sp.]
MPLPAAIRRLTPDRLRDDPRLRAIAVGSGLIPPRTMHSEAEAELLRRLARDARRVVEIGVYEGSSAVAVAEVMGPSQELHLIDPFGHHPTALPSGWGATERASRRVVARAARHGGPRVTWHVALSHDVAPAWTAPIDLLFIDGDHAEEGVQRDWDDWHGHIAPGGHVLFHDARDGRPEGRGLPGPTAVVDRLVRGPQGPPPGWSIAAEVDRTVALRRDG